jgi:Zn-dependent peptidase ImmA (M78 family)
MMASAIKLVDFDRRKNANRAIQLAAAVRQRTGATQHLPICIYDVCEKLNVAVRFIDNNMEGMYQKGNRPQIYLSSKRPLARRAFNCAHELGHHEFGDGSSIDVLQENALTPSWDDPKEFLADSFAAHILMPIVGLRGAFNSRGLNCETATPTQLYVIACDFGVGYATLVTHLSTGLRMITVSRAAELKRWSPKTIRASLLGEDTKASLVVAGANRFNSRIDVEVGTLVLLPREAVVDADKLRPVRQLKNGSLFEATKPGIAQIRTSKWAAFARIARAEYMGLARYRHLEDV